MNRRDFIKLLVAAPTLVLPIPALAHRDPLSGMVREVACYDIETDRFILRHDVWDGHDLQAHVDTQFSSKLIAAGVDAPELQRCRAVALLVLGAHVSFNDCGPLARLPLPKWSEHARYI